MMRQTLANPSLTGKYSKTSKGDAVNFLGVINLQVGGKAMHEG